MSYFPVFLYGQFWYWSCIIFFSPSSRPTIKAPLTHSCNQTCFFQKTFCEILLTKQVGRKVEFFFFAANALNSCVSHFHRCWLWVWHLLHLRAETGHQDAMAGPGWHWPDVGASASHLAAQRASLRRPDRAKQGRDGCQARRGSGEDLEALVWYPSSPHGSRPWLLCYHQQGKIWYLQYIHNTTKELCWPVRKDMLLCILTNYQHTGKTKKSRD